MPKTYHGWIYVDKEPGFRDNFSVQYRRNHFNKSLGLPGGPTDEGESVVMDMGRGRAAEAVAFFEDQLHAPVRLEPTPIGLRVFTGGDDPPESAFQ